MLVVRPRDDWGLRQALTTQRTKLDRSDQ
jgi:hypothetical protein